LIETKPLREIDSLLAERVVEGDFPSAVYLVKQKRQEILSNALGLAVKTPVSIPATVETIYDLASLTKPLATALSCAIAVQTGRLELDRPVSSYLPEFDRPEKREIRVSNLLTHTSGLPAWRPLYLLTNDRRDGVLTKIADQPLEYPRGERVLYSDLGFITLGFILESIYAQPLQEIVQSNIFRPLNLAHTFYNPDPALRESIAASEAGNRYEEAMCIDPLLNSSEFKWRTGVVWGQVHDGNAWALGGVAGHAGIFSTAAETAVLAEQFLSGRSRLLTPDICASFTMNMTQGLNESRSLGWQLAATPDSTAGPDLPSDSFGHNGFTGTCCWVDPNTESVFVLLTNRTHERTLPFANINSIRRRFNSIAARFVTTSV
jgi:CubicO group peptidase (beta-lactamase class C family)